MKELNVQQVLIEYENDPELKKAIDAAAEGLASMLSAIQEELKKIDPQAVITDPNLPDSIKQQAIHAALIKHAPHLFPAQQLREHGVVTADNDTKAIQTKNINVLIDKLNSTGGIWSDLQLDAKGQRKIKTGSTKAEFVVFELNFSKLDIDIAHKLDDKDKLVYLAVCSLWSEAQKKGIPPVFSLTQIYKTMNGGTSHAPSKKNILEIYDILRKLRLTEVTINAEKEFLNNKIKGTARAIRNEVLLSFRFTAALINDNFVAEAVRILDEPALQAYSRDRGMISTAPVKVLDIPLSNTARQTKLKLYLIERIVHMKNDFKKAKEAARKKKEYHAPPARIVLSSLFEKCDADDRQKRMRCKKDTLIALDSFKDKNWIADYSVTKTAIDIILKD